MVNEQAEKYTIKELTNIFNTPDNVVRKKVKNHQLKTAKELINGRQTTVVELTASKISEIIKEIEVNKNTYKPDNDHIVNQSISNQEPEVYQSEIVSQQDNTMVEIMREFSNQISSAYKLVSEKDSKILLLEDSETRKENEYLRQIAEFKTLVDQLESDNKLLKSDNERLRNELEQERKRPFWKKNLI